MHILFPPLSAVLFILSFPFNTSGYLVYISLVPMFLLKSAELTGLWEKKLRLIERCEYSPSTFLEELKSMVVEVVSQVK